MKKLIYTLVISILVLSCGGGDNPPPPVNNAPTVPGLLYPTNNLLCIDNSVEFKWSASTDQDGDAVKYQIEVAKDAQFTQIIHNVISTSTSRRISLEKGIAYYWRAKALDAENAASNYSSTNQFYTEGEGVTNHLPFAPVLVSPELNAIATEATVNLQWTANDVDTSDTLTFDVYFGTANPPTEKIAADHTSTNIDVNLSATTMYYWKIEVKDGHGGQTNGQVWNFTTD